MGVDLVSQFTALQTIVVARGDMIGNGADLSKILIRRILVKKNVAINVQMQHVGQRILASTHGEKEQCLEAAGLDGKNYRYILYILLERPCKSKKNWKKNLCMIQAPLLALANG